MNHKSFIKRGVAALLALLVMLTAVPMTNVFAAEDDSSEMSEEISVEESAISTSFDQEVPMDRSEEVIELPDEAGESSEEEESDPIRAGPEETKGSAGKSDTETETTAVEAAVITPDLAFGYASYDVFASERAGMALTRTEQQIQFFNTFVDQVKLSSGATIDTLFGADNENYSAEYLLSLNPNQFTETAPVYIGTDGNYYVVSAVQALNRIEAADSQSATAFYNGISEAFTDILYLGSGVYQIPAKRAEYCFSEHYFTDDAAGNIIGVTFGLRIQQLFGYNPAESAERTIVADVLYPDATEKILPATVNLNSGTVTVKLFPDDSGVDLSSGYNLAAVINKGESIPSCIQLIDGGKTAVFSVGDARAVGCLDIAIAYQAPANPGIPMKARMRAIQSDAPPKSVLRGAVSGSYSMYDSNYAEVDPEQIPSNLAVGDKFYFNTRLHVAGVYDSYDPAGNLHVGANSIPTHEAQSFTYYNELADWMVIKNWFVTKLNDATYPDPDTDAPGVMRQMTEANMLARAAVNSTSSNLGGAHIFGYVSDPLGTNTTNGKTLDLSGISVAIGCMHAWAYMGSTAPVDVVASIYRFTGTDSWAPQQAYGFFEPVIALQCTEIRKEGNTTYATFKVVTQMLEIGNVQNPANYQCGFATLRLAYEKEDTGFAKVVKSSGNSDVTDGNACYSLKGTEYTIYTDPACTVIAKDVNGSNAVLTVQDETGNTNTAELEAGTYYVKETKAGKGYFRDPNKRTVTVEAGKTASVPVTDQPGLDPINLRLTKQDASTGSAQGNTSLAGAEYTMKYYDNQNGSGNPKRTWVFRTDSNGIIRYSETYKISGDNLYYNSNNFPAFPIGTITIQEMKAPAGYLINPEIYTVHVTLRSDMTVRTDKGTWNTVNQADDLTIESEEPAVLAGIRVKKQDKETVTAQGNADLSGIEFTIRNGNGKAVNIGGRNYENNAVILTITSDINGIAKTSKDALPVGKYLVQETKTNDSYVLTDGTARTVVISNSDNGKLVSVDQDGKDITFKNTVKKGAVRVIKHDREHGAVPQGDADFTGVRFGIINAGSRAVKVNGQLYEPGETVLTLTANAAGNAQSAKVLPYGTYTIRETASNNAYLMTDGSEYTFRIRMDGEVVTGTVDDNAVIFKNTVVKGGVKIGKTDCETGTSEPQGAASLKGAEFTVFNNSGKPVMVSGKEYSPGEAVTVLVTGEDGTAQTSANLLPYGSYYAKETKAPEGYVLNTGWRKDFEIRQNRKIVDLTDDPAPDDIRRADLEFLKTDSNDNPMPGIPFLIERLDEEGHVVEAHVAVTDEEGRLSTKERPKTGDRVNCLDSFVSEGLFTDEERLDYTAGVWFGEQSAKEEGRGSLIYANYRITELKCEANRTHDILVRYLLDEDDMEELNTVFTDGKVFTFSEPLRDYEIQIESDLIDTLSGTKTVSVGPEVTLKDTIRYNCLKAGSRYKVVTEIWYRDPGDSAPVLLGSEEKEFMPENAEGTGTESDTVSDTAGDTADDIAGDTVGNTTGDTVSGTVDNYVTVSTLYLYRGSLHAVDRFYAAREDGWTELADHNTEMDNPRQRLDFPFIRTNASDGRTGDHTGTCGEKETVIDTVTYEGLTPGKTYTVSGTLHYRDIFTDKEGREHAAGEEVLDKDGKPVTASSTFTAEEADGTVDLVYELDTSLLCGASIVVFEDLYYDNAKIISHADLEDEDQRIDYPDVKTSASDAFTDDRVGSAGTMKLTDTVKLTNLTAGKEYRVSGILMDRETGEPFLDDEGKEITSESEIFTAEDPEMQIEMTFEAAIETLSGRTTVVFENLIHNGITVSCHHEISDEDQSVHFPEIGTTALAGETEDHVIGADEEVTITDTVHYRNLLTDGREYTVSGVLVDKETGNPILIGGEEITNEKVFIPEETEGDVEIVFTFDASALAGTTLVAFESLEYKGIEAAVHADINDEEQTVNIPRIRTQAYDKKTGIDHSKAEYKVTLYDNVTFTNLLPERDYVMKGYLVDKKTGEPILIDGKRVEAEKEFFAEAESGVVIMEFTFDASLITPEPVVVFESLYYKDIEIAAHTDIEDEEQSDYIPEIGTTAVAADTGDHITNADEEVIIIDTVSYRGLKPNTKYEVEGILTDRETGEPFLDDEDHEIRSARTFVTGKAKEGEVSVDGEVKVTFTLDGSDLSGRTTVVFETLYRDGKEVAVHADIEDEEQTIHFPDAKTTATDKSTENHTAHLGEKVVIEDLVKYKNLIPGKTYTVKGTLMMKETGEALLNGDGETVTAEKKFKAEKANGEILLSFTADTTKLVGKSVVVFEDVQYEGITVVLHADLEDEEQTVVVPEIRTTATDKVSGEKTMTLGEEVTLADTIGFTGLTPGEEYILKGRVMDKADGKVLKTGDREVISERRFIPEDTGGNVCVEFVINTNDLKGKELVIFETLYDLKGNLIAVHEDINDQEQTVKIPTEPPEEPPKIIITGDEHRPWPYFVLIGISAAVLMIVSMTLVHFRKKH